MFPNSVAADVSRRRIWARAVRFRRVFRWVVVAVSVLAALGCLLLRWTPIPPALFKPPPGQIEFTDRHDISLRTVRLQDRPFGQPVSYPEIPQALLQATLAAEDKRFWQHPGVDWRGISRALWSLVRHRRILSGGSTITQQLIKLGQPRPRTIPAKFMEALQAIRLERTWDKQRILTEYLNRIDYGNLINGCAAAAEFYFGKPLGDLSPAECALLAGLPQAPSRLNPLRHFQRAQQRQQWILRRMLACGFITPEEFDRACREELRLAAPQRAFEAPHFVDLLLQQEEIRMEPAQPLPWPGSGQRHRRVRTSIDLGLNRLVQQSLRLQLTRLQPQHVGNGAAVVIDNRCGEVLALVGSEDYSASDAGQVNGAWARRSAGSTFKPFTYLIAMEQGATPATIVADVPAEFVTATGLFAPVNYDRRCHGPVRYRLALANSWNIAAVNVLAAIGGPAVLQDRMRACGLTTLNGTPEYYGLGLTIGNAEARLLELANAYACLARLGEFQPYRLVADTAPAAPRTAPTSGRRVFDASTSFLIADILSDNKARLQAFGPDSSLRFDFAVACKTGTSSDFRDNWAFGYTPEFTVGVWVGNFDGSSMQEISGVTGAAPVMHELMEYLHQRYGTSWYTQPENVTQMPIHSITGHRLTQRRSPDSWAILEKFITSHLPPEESARDYDSQGRVRLPPEYKGWLTTSDNWLAGKAVVDYPASALRITFPLPGTKFFLDPDLPDRGRRVCLRAEGAMNLEWTCDTLPCLSEGRQTTALLALGKHHLQARDRETGAIRETWIEVSER